MNKKILLKCWSSNPDVYSDIAAAVVHVDSGLREMAWELFKLRQVAGKTLKEKDFFSSDVSLGLSFFHPYPDFIREPQDEDDVWPEVFVAFEAMENGCEAVVLSAVGFENLEGLAQGVDLARVHVFEAGLYWTTYPKCCDHVQVTTATLTWKKLGLK